MSKNSDSKVIKPDLTLIVHTNVNRLIVNFLKEKGYNNKEISELTHLTYSSVKQHIKRYRDSIRIEGSFVSAYLSEIIEYILYFDSLPTKKGITREILKFWLQDVTQES